MSGCCNPRGGDEFFDNRFAARVARRYEQRGLDRTARRMVEFIEQQGIDDATVLEIGGGVGEIQIELLKRGASHAVNLELSSAYDAEALKLLRQNGFERLVERRLCDVAVDGGFVRPADVVVLHRVVCCYPDYVRLLTEVAQHSRRLVVFSHPPRNPVSRLAVAAANLRLRLQRKDFRVFVHPPAALLGVLEQQGLRPTFTHRGLVWQIQGLER